MLCSAKNSRVLLSLDQVVKANDDQNLQRISEFDKLEKASSLTLERLQQIQVLYDNFVESGEGRDLALADSLNDLSTKLLARFRDRVSAENAILNSLSYRSMSVRHEKIPEAHAKTFDWIYHDRSVDHDTPFVDWLTDATGFFWITGKAGSGKSTFMKFLSHHDRTRSALKSWSGQQTLVLASFYFWFAGTRLQKSQEGLLQSLLHQIFRKCPDLIMTITPQRWEQYHCNSSEVSEWTRSELVVAFKNLVLCPRLGKKFCFFIDGLDEYDGDHRDLIILIQGFAKSTDVKFCVSSRPWNDFENSFGNGLCPALRLQDLTKEDIRLYVKDKLEDNNAFRRLRFREEESCDRLVSEIVQKAHGVFLWVFLVIRSLTSGLVNADRIVDLRRRLKHFPEDLETYFQHMFDNIDPSYQQQTAQTFQVALRASEPLSLMTYSMLDELEVDHDFALNLRPRRLSNAEIESIYHDMKLRINARCKDLLEVTRIVDPRFPHCSEMMLKTSRATFSEYQVDFLHRTVRDFCHIRRIHDWIEAHVSSSFNANQVLCAAFLAQIKNVSLDPKTDLEYQRLSDLVADMARYARLHEIEMGVPLTALVDCLSKILASLQDSYRCGVPSQISNKVTGNMTRPGLDGVVRPFLQTPLAFAVYYDLKVYVADMLSKRGHRLSSYAEDAVLYAAASRLCSPTQKMDDEHSEMLCIIVSRGATFVYEEQLEILRIANSGVDYIWESESLKAYKMACSKVYGLWADTAHDFSNPNLKIWGAFSYFGASTTKDSHILPWFMCVIKSQSNWRRQP